MKKTIVFESFQGRNFSDSPRALYEKLLADSAFSDWRFVWAFKDPEKYLEAFSGYDRTTVVRSGSASHRKAYRSAKAWVVNALIPLNIQKRKGQIAVQTWHGTPIKKLRVDISNVDKKINTAKDFSRKNRLDVPRYDIFLAQSDYAAKAFSSAFELEKLGLENILLVGELPRNEYLYSFESADAARVKTELGLNGVGKIILFTPTWRDNSASFGGGYKEFSGIDFQKILDHFGTDSVLLYRSHYYVTHRPNLEEFGGRVLDVSLHEDLNELFIVSDALVTDYSSVIFDYRILGRPIYLYRPDFSEYEQLRGFYEDVVESSYVSSVSDGSDFATLSFGDIFSKLDGYLDVSREIAKRIQR